MDCVLTENLAENFLTAAGVEYRRQSARNNLKETFLVLPTMYNIRDMEKGIFLELFK